MNASKCDVCGKFYIPDLKDVGNGGSCFINRYHGDGSREYFTYDLCIECTKKLDELLSNE